MRGKEVILPTQPARSGTVVVTIGGRVSPSQVEGTCAELRGAMGACDLERVVCDVARVRPDAATVDLLARLALMARRQGRRMVLAGVPLELSDLLAFVGLDEVPGLRREPEWLPERGEDSLDVEEERDPGDPAP